MIDTKEIRKALAIHGVDVLNEAEVLDVLDQLEAAEKECESWKGLAQQFSKEADGLRTHLSFAKDELNRLRAKIEAMEKQEPVATVRINAINGNPSVDFVPGHRYLHHNDKLYALPGALSVQGIPEG